MKEKSRLGEKLLNVLSSASLQTETLTYGMDYNSRNTKSAVGTYINFLKVGKYIPFSLFGIKEDKSALKAIRQFYPFHELLPVNSRSIADEGGVLNCIGWVKT